MKRFILFSCFIVGLCACGSVEELPKSQSVQATLVSSNIGDYLQRKQHIPVTRSQQSWIDVRIYPKTTVCSTGYLQDTLHSIQSIQEHMVQFYLTQLERQIRRRDMPNVQSALYMNPFDDPVWTKLAAQTQDLIKSMSEHGVLVYSTDQIKRYNVAAHPNRHIRTELTLPNFSQNTLVLACGVRTAQLYAGQDWLMQQQKLFTNKAHQISEFVTFALSADHVIYTHNLQVTEQIKRFKDAKTEKLARIPKEISAINVLFEEQLYAKLNRLVESAYLLPNHKPIKTRKIPVETHCLAENISSCALSQFSSARMIYTEHSRLDWLMHYMLKTEK